MKKSFDVITLGDVIQDVFLELDLPNVHLHRLRGEPQELCLAYGTKVPVTAKHDTLGGNAANAAVAFARLGLDTAMYTHVGGDDTGERIRKELLHNGVAKDYLAVDRHLATSSNTVLSVEGERTILTYHIERHYCLPKLAPARWVYLSSMRQGCEGIYSDILEYVEDSGAQLCFQPGTYQVKTGPKAVRHLLKATSLFVCNREEAELYLGKQPGAQIEELLDGVRLLGPRLAVLTDGRKGAYASDGTAVWHLDVIEDIPRIDTTGAGDAFAAGVMAALAHGLELPEALRWGQAESSGVIQFVGAQVGLLHQRQLESLLAKHLSLQARKLP